MAKKRDWWRIYGMKNEQRDWNAVGLYRAEVAALWKAYGFEPNEEVKVWIESRTESPESADIARATPVDSAEWSGLEAWRVAGFRSVEEVRGWLGYGLTNPLVCRDWRDAKFAPETALKLLARGYTAQLANDWRDAGVPVAFMVYVHAARGMSLEQALKWSYPGVSMSFKLRASFAMSDYELQDILNFYYLGFTTDEMYPIFFGRENEAEAAIALLRSYDFENMEEQPEWEDVVKRARAVGMSI